MPKCVSHYTKTQWLRCNANSW